MENKKTFSAENGAGEWPQGDRVILHCDCNSFFASVETVLNPAYRGRPMAVCGSQEDRHGIVLAKNEEAKKFGIQTAETVWSAKRKCPDLVIAPPHHDAYEEFSHRINLIFDRYTDQVEKFSIDESWLDVTASQHLFGDGPTIAHAIRRAVREEIGVTVSLGVSFNKVFAKLGSDYKKPDAVTVIRREDVPRIVYPLPVSDMLYVGRRTAESLAAINIRTIGDLAAASPAFLAARYGKMGELLSRYARGEDDSPVLTRDEAHVPKSVGNGRTFRRDIETPDDIRVALLSLCEDVALRLSQADMRALGLSVSVKDTLLHTVSRQGMLDAPTRLARELADAAFSLLASVWHIGRPIRALTVTATHLLPDGVGGEQIGFFDEERDRRRERAARLQGAMQSIRGRFGRSAISSGAVLGSDFGLSPAKNLTAGHEASGEVEKTPEKS